MDKAVWDSDEDVRRDFNFSVAVTRLITSEELKEKLDRGDDFKLVMAFADWHFHAAHIPGSISVGSPAEAAELLDPDDEIVVYCTNVDCPASKRLYRYLEATGYRKIRRYADGIDGWLEAGHPLEGEQSEVRVLSN